MEKVNELDLLYLTQPTSFSTLGSQEIADFALDLTQTFMPINLSFVVGAFDYIRF